MINSSLLLQNVNLDKGDEPRHAIHDVLFVELSIIYEYIYIIQLIAFSILHSGIRHDRQRAASARAASYVAGRLSDAGRHRKSQQEADGADEEQQRPPAAARGAGEAGPEAGITACTGMPYHQSSKFTLILND